MVDTIKKRFQHEYQEIINDFNDNLRYIDTYDESFCNCYVKLLQDYNRKINELESEIEVLKKVNDDAEVQFNQCHIENSKLRQQLYDKDKSLEMLKKNHENVVDVLNNNMEKEKQKTNEEFECTFSEKLSKIDQLLNEIKAKNDYICNQTKINDENLKEIVRLKDVLEEQKIVIQDLHTQLNNVNNKSEHDKQHRIECETKYFNDVMDLKRTNCDLHSNINELNLKNESLKTANRVLKKKYNDMENKYRVQHEKVIRDVSIVSDFSSIK